MADEDTPDPGRDFAALMSGAAATATPDAEEAPYGWTIDRGTGERRPKRAQGRVRKSPGLEDLKTAAAEEAPVEGVVIGDRAPAPPGNRHQRRAAAAKARKAGTAKDGKDADKAAIPQHRPGVITKGVNKLYRRCGKIVKAMDRDIGIAIIESTKNTAEEDGEDDSVGAAWEEVCRTNPRIRAFMLRMIAGGAWGQLLMAHAPILLAILMKDGIRKHIPFVKLLEAMAEPDEDGDGDEDGEGAEGLASLMKGLKPEDMQQMMGMAQQMMGATARKVA